MKIQELPILEPLTQEEIVNNRNERLMLEKKMRDWSMAEYYGGVDELGNRHQELKSLALIDNKLTRLDPSFIEMTVEVEGLSFPKFSLIPHDSTECKIEFSLTKRINEPEAGSFRSMRQRVQGFEFNINAYYHTPEGEYEIGGMRNRIPDCIGDSILSISQSNEDRLDSMLDRDSSDEFATVSVKATDQLSNLIPDEVRKLINLSKHDFDEMYIVKEAEWDVKIDSKTFNQPKTLDPLLIGEKNDHLYLLAHFDMTPAEDYLIKEYTV